MVVLCVLPFRRYSNASIRKSAGRFKFSSISHSLSMRQKSFLFVRSIAFDIWLFFFLFVCLIFTYRVRARSRVHHTYVGWTTVSAFKWWAMHWLNLPLQKNHLFHHSSKLNWFFSFQFFFDIFDYFEIFDIFAMDNRPPEQGENRPPHFLNVVRVIPGAAARGNLENNNGK